MELNEEIFDIESLSRFLKVSQPAIRKYMSEGNLPYHCPNGGRIVRYLKSEIVEWLREQPNKHIKGGFDGDNN